MSDEREQADAIVAVCATRWPAYEWAGTGPDGWGLWTFTATPLGESSDVRRRYMVNPVMFMDVSPEAMATLLEIRLELKD